MSWGSADFIAAEEMGRTRGYWWSPDGTAIAACRVDVTDVDTWHIADPANPSVAPHEIRYPRAGTTNPDVRLYIVPIDGSERIEIDWDRDVFPYIADVAWNRHGLYVTIQSRDQRHVMTLQADPATGATEEVLSDRDDDWVELVPGTPRHDAEGRLVTCGDRDGVRHLLVDDVPVSPPDAAGACRRLRRRHARRHWRNRVPGEPHRRSDRAARLATAAGQGARGTHRRAGHPPRIRRRRDRRRAVGDAR